MCMGLSGSKTLSKRSSDGVGVGMMVVSISSGSLPSAISIFENP